jgi:hypothetical protein
MLVTVEFSSCARLETTDQQSSNCAQTSVICLVEKTEGSLRMSEAFLVDLDLALRGQRGHWCRHRDPELVGTHDLREYLVFAQSNVDLGVDQVFE